MPEMPKLENTPAISPRPLIIARQCDEAKPKHRPATPRVGRLGQRSGAARLPSEKISARLPGELVNAARKQAGDAGLTALLEDAVRQHLAQPAPTQPPSAPQLGPDLAEVMAAVGDLSNRVNSLQKDIEVMRCQSNRLEMQTAQLVEFTKNQLHEQQAMLQQMGMMLAVFSRPLGLDHLELFRKEFAGAHRKGKAK